MPKVLYILNGGLGDVVMALPALEALHRKTDLTIDVVVQNAAAHSVLARIPYVGEVFACPLWSVRNAPGVLSLAWKLRRRRYVLGVFGHGPARPKTRLLMSFAATGRTVPARLVGWSGDKCLHKVDMALQNLAELDISCNPGRAAPVFPLEEADRSRAAEIWKSWEIPADIRTVALINGGGPNAYAGLKKWPAERWHRLICELLAMGIAPIYFAGPDEREQGYALRGQLGGNLRVADQMDICLYAALLERCTAVVSNDTGLMHIAWAVGAPVVGLYGPTLPQLTGAYGGGNVALRFCTREKGCYFGGQSLSGDCDAATCMATIEVADVVSAISSVLYSSQTRMGLHA